MNSTIPHGWTVKPLASIASVNWGDTSLTKASYVARGYPAYSASGFDGYLPDFQFDQDGIVLSAIGARCGRVFYATGKWTAIKNTITLFGKPGKSSTRFLYQYFGKPDAWDISGGAQPFIGLTNARKLDVLTPPLPEQQKIAAILSSVDDVIEKTRAQIDKLKDLKTSMMQELLTKGIGSGGAPHTEFKDSPVGRIPAAWSTVNLESLLAEVKYPMRSGPFGSSLLKHELVETGVPYLGIDNVHVEHFERKYKRFVSDQKFKELSRYAVRERDVMVTIMGTVGRCCVVPTGVGKALSSKHVWTMTFDQEKYVPELICWQINYATWVADQFKNESQGGVMESISSKTLKSLLVPLPPLPEQRKIAEAHRKTSKVISEKSEQLANLINLKKALMQDLLTGKVRVKVDQKESAVA